MKRLWRNRYSRVAMICLGVGAGVAFVPDHIPSLWPLVVLVEMGCGGLVGLMVVVNDAAKMQRRSHARSGEKDASRL